MSSKSITILGTGWLGTPIAGELSKRDWSVTTTNTQTLRLPDDFNTDTLTQALNTHTLLVTLPFSRKLGNPFDYSRLMKQLAAEITTSPIQHVLFTSSTSIYPLTDGIVTEDTPLPLETNRQKALFQAEKSLLDIPNTVTTIFRCGGLYGPEREIGKYRKFGDIVPDGPTNYIHQDEATKHIISHIETPNTTSEIYNLVQDTHPLKSELYSDLNLNISFTPPSPNSTKIVSNKKINHRHLK